MEDYQAAYLARSKDVDVLHESTRRTAAMHFGGVVIECMLKYILSQIMPSDHRGKKHWNTGENNPGHTIERPGHDFSSALGLICLYKPKFNNKYQQSYRLVKKWLEKVENPTLHAENLKFIDMRYKGSEPDNQSYQEWYKSYNELKKWLSNRINEGLN